MSPSIEFTTKLVSEDTTVIIHGLHCHKQSSHNYKAILWKHVNAKSSKILLKTFSDSVSNILPSV